MIIYLKKLKLWQRVSLDALIILFVVGVAFLVLRGVKAEAAINNVFEWAWSENIGWISFSSENCDSNGDGISDTLNFAQCPVGDAVSAYGVLIDDLTREFSGYAWSENVGWLSFNRAETGNPPAPPFNGGAGPIAMINPWLNESTGWMRALSACPSIPCATTDNEGGWDGWLKLRNDSLDIPAIVYGVDRDTSPIPDEFVGWAWAGKDTISPSNDSGVVGWLSFNNVTDGSPDDYQVITDINFTPIVADPPSPGMLLDVSAGPSCTSSMAFSWTFLDPEDGINQSGYHLQIANDSGFLGIQFDSGSVVSGTQSRTVNITRPSIGEGDDGNPSNGTGTLAFREDNVDPDEYYWRIRVMDSGGKWSGWFVYLDNTGAAESFLASLHPAPQTNFSWLPDPPSEGETIFFTDSSIFDGTCAGACQSWLWTIPGAVYVGGTSDTDQNPQVEFSSFGNKNIFLTSRDGILAGDVPSSPGECAMTYTINVRPPLPDYKETIPVSFLDSIKRLFTSKLLWISLVSNFIV